VQQGFLCVGIFDSARLCPKLCHLTRWSQLGSDESATNQRREVSGLGRSAAQPVMGGRVGPHQPEREQDTLDGPGRCAIVVRAGTPGDIGL